MRFGSPQYFWMFLGAALIIGFYLWAYQRKQGALARFASAPLAKKLTPTTSASRQVLKWVIFLIAYLFLVAALVRPRFGVKMELIERRGVDIIVALDISQSMLAEDITPNRLDRAKHEIAKFIDLLKGDRIGLVIFAGESFVQCPLTLDYGAAKLFLAGVTTDWIQLQGTALSDAITKSAAAFHSKGRKHKVLIILSDGEEHEGDAVEAARKAAREGVRIFTIGIGSERGVPVPVRQGRGSVVYKKDGSGNLVMTRLNPIVLEKIALEGNGRYFNAGANLELRSIYDEITAMEKKDLSSTRMAVFEERYQIFLLIALVFLILEFFIPEHVRQKTEWKGRFE